MICPNCGTKCDEETKECILCGYWLDDSASSSGSNNTTSATEVKPESTSSKPADPLSKSENKDLSTNTKPAGGSKKKFGIIGGLCAAGAAAGIIIPLVITNVSKSNMSLEEQLESLQAKAETVSSIEEAEKIYKEAEEIQRKIDESIEASSLAKAQSELASIEAEAAKQTEGSAQSEANAQAESTQATFTQSQSVAANVSEPAVVTAEPAVIISKAGNILNVGQVDSYTFDAPNDGRYRAEISGLSSGSVDLDFYDAYGNLLESQVGCRNGDGVTVKDLTAGSSYEVRVSENSGTASYMLSVGLQKAPLDISNVTEAKDSVEYTDQRNLYNFTPAANGDYRFELSDVDSGVLLDMFVFDDPGNKLDSREAAGSGQGLTIKNMKGGEVYEIQVRQSKGLGEYSLLVK